MGGGKQPLSKPRSAKSILSASQNASPKRAKISGRTAATGGKNKPRRLAATHAHSAQPGTWIKAEAGAACAASSLSPFGTSLAGPGKACIAAWSQPRNGWAEQQDPLQRYHPSIVLSHHT